MDEETVTTHELSEVNKHKPKTTDTTCTELLSKWDA